MANNNTTGLNYTDLDESSIKTSLTNYLKNTLGWATLTDDDTFAVIRDTLAGVAAFLIYLIERRAEETYIDTARTTAAIMKIARSLGYIPRRRVSASTNLRFSLAGSDNVVSSEVVGSGDGLTKVYSGTLVYSPVKRSSLSVSYYIAGSLYVATDNGDGDIVGNLISSSSVDYATGAWAITFTENIDNVKDIVANYKWLSTTHTSNVLIPAETKVSSSAGIAFITLESAVIPAGQAEVDVIAKQGVVHTDTFTSDGTANQKFFFEMENAEESYVYVKVNGVSWNVEDTLIYSEETSEDVAVEVSNEFTGLNIYFGDNLLGKIPAKGDTIEVKALESEGTGGNIGALNDITTIDDTILDALSVEVSDISVTNVEFASGGQEREDMVSVQRNAPRLYRIGDHVLTTKQDWLDWMNAYAGVLKANVWGEYDDNPNLPNIALANIVNVSILTTDGQIMTDSFKTTMLTALVNFKEINTRVVLYDVPIVKVLVESDLYVERNRQIEGIRSAVQTALDESISYTTLGVGEALRHSVLTQMLEAVDGVSYSYTILKIYDRNTLGDGTSLTYAGNTITGAIKAGTLKVYRLSNASVETEWGHDAGGTIIGIGMGSAGSISYATGAFIINLLNPLLVTDYLLFVYEQDERGDLLAENDQIFDLERADLTLSYE